MDEEIEKLVNDTTIIKVENILVKIIKSF